MNMIRLIPDGSCPKCSHRQFIVREFIANTYLTGIDGEIIDGNEDKHTMVGICLNCGKQYPMASTYNGFIPLTPIRKLLREYAEEVVYVIPDDMTKELTNPMDLKGD